jgi:hypothetical protein
MTMMSGVVQQVSTKEVNTKFGPKPTYSIKVDGKWVKCGFKNPNVEAGHQVDFDAVAGTYGLETKLVNIISKGTAPSAVAETVAAPAVTQRPAYSSSKVFPIPALHGDRAIVRQNALARATDLYISARGGKPWDLDESNLDFVIKLARKFEAYTAGDLDLAEALAEDTNVPVTSNESTPF